MEGLKTALGKMLGQDITSTEYQMETLQGGTVGDVLLVSGMANDAHFKIVLKIQKKWERWGDPNSWRREYDLYVSNLGESFSPIFSWPKCYHAEINESGDETRLWMEYIDGATGDDLTIEMLEQAAWELGHYQSKTSVPGIVNLGEQNAIETHYRHWKQKNVEYKYIRDPNCKIPKHLCDMLIDIDSKADEIFANIRKLPVVFCHRDFWITNIIHTQEGISLIDWDTAGPGYLGEDIIQLITDGTNCNLWEEYKNKLIPAYFKGYNSRHYKEPATKQSTGHDLYSIICQIPLVHLGYLSVFYLMQDDLVAGEHYPGIESLQKLYEVFYK